eukprot:7015575-Alexandrium_andersonii.AAC.1
MPRAVHIRQGQRKRGTCRKVKGPAEGQEHVVQFHILLEQWECRLRKTADEDENMTSKTHLGIIACYGNAPFSAYYGVDYEYLP